MRCILQLLHVNLVSGEPFLQTLNLGAKLLFRCLFLNSAGLLLVLGRLLPCLLLFWRFLTIASSGRSSVAFGGYEIQTRRYGRRNSPISVASESSSESVFSESYLGCLRFAARLFAGRSFASATVGRPVLGSRVILGTGLDVLARIIRGWFSRLLYVARRE